MGFCDLSDHLKLKSVKSGKSSIFGNEKLSILRIKSFLCITKVVVHCVLHYISLKKNK